MPRLSCAAWPTKPVADALCEERPDTNQHHAGEDVRVAIIALGHSGDPAAVGHLSGRVADPETGVRQQVAMALGEFDAPESAAALAKLLVNPEPAVASAAADSMAEFKDPA